MLDLSGEGCRQLEEIFEEDNDRSWTEFFRSLYDDDIFGKNLVVDTKITRIDIALDELIVEGKKNVAAFLMKRGKWSIKAYLCILAADNLLCISTSIKKILN